MHSQSSSLYGEYHDRIITAGSRVIDLGWRSNIIVDRCRELLAAFMKGDSALGLQFLAVGQGDALWDSQPAGPSSPGTQKLADAGAVHIPVAGGSVVYLDAAGTAVAGPTHRILVTVTIEPGTPAIENGKTSYPLREFGLFGKLGAAEYMIDYVRHPVIHKQAGDTLVRTIRLVF